MVEKYFDRCRLVLIIPPLENAVDLVSKAIKGGDIASVIMPSGDMAKANYQNHATEITKICQNHNIASLVVGDSQIMGRSGADGLFVPSQLNELIETIARFSPKRIVGYGGVRSRHESMEAAESGSDFLFLGNLDGDIKPEAHPKNIKLGEWCASVMQPSVIVMGGSSLESVVEVAQSGVDFVGLSKAVFLHEPGPEAGVREANRLLDEYAPRFDDEN